MTVQRRRNYTTEFRKEAVNLVAEQGYKLQEAARNLGINEGFYGDGCAKQQLPKIKGLALPLN